MGKAENNVPYSEKLLEKLINAPAYEPGEKDSELFKAFDKAGKMAAENVFALASTKTGGYANSYAGAAAALAYDELMKDYRDAETKAEEKSYKRYSDTLDRLFKLYDKVRQSEKDKTEKAETAAEYGDTGLLAGLGINPEDYTPAAILKQAELFAKFGDYSLLRKLGYKY